MNDDPFAPFSKHRPPVPEPATFGLVIVVIALAIYFYRRRKR